MDWRKIAFSLGALSGFIIPFLIPNNEIKKEEETSEEIIEEIEPFFEIEESNFNSNNDTKLVIVVPDYIKFKSSELSNNIANVTIHSVMDTYKTFPKVVSNWYTNYQAKIIVRAPKIEVMDEVLQKLVNSNIPHTELFNSSSQIIALAVGPFYKNDIDNFTRHLKLLN